MLVVAFWIVEPSFERPWSFYKMAAAIFVLVQWPIYYMLHLWLSGKKRVQGKSYAKNFSMAWKVRWQFFITFVLSFFLLGLVQYWAAKVPYEWSLSLDSKNRISAQTETAIMRFEQIKLMYFAEPEMRENFLPWALFLKRKFSSIIEMEVIDPNLSPTLLERYQVKKVPALVIQTNRGVQNIYEFSELAFAQGLTKILRPTRPMVCFTAQHGEYRITDETPAGLSQFKLMLQNDRFAVSEWDFISTCDYLVVMGPTRDLSTTQASQLQTFLNAPGLKGVLVAMELPFPKKLPQWEKVLKSKPIQLTFLPGIILDQSSPQLGLEASIVTGIMTEQAAKQSWPKEDAGKMIFPMSRGLDLSLTPQWHSLMNAQAFPNTWLETDVKTLFSSGKATYQKASDQQGVFPLIALQEVSSPRIRVAALASARMVQNGYANQLSNFQNLLNLITWGVFLDQEISANRPELSSQSLTFVASQLQLLFYLSVLVIPFFMISMAWWIWRRQRLVVTSSSTNSSTRTS
jgi:hypothetical protein